MPTCRSALEKAYYKRCTLCGKSICYSEYEVIKTKASRSRLVSFKGKELYVHRTCYKALFTK